MGVNELLGGADWEKFKGPVCAILPCDKLLDFAVEKANDDFNDVEFQKTDVKRGFSSCSAKSLLHFSQLLDSDEKFRQYDW